MTNYYRVTFDTKKGAPKRWEIHVGANTADKAKSIARDLWNADDCFNNMHMFHVQVRRLDDTEEVRYHYFKLIRMCIPTM